MKSFRRLSTIDQAEIALEQGLAEGRWTKTLPTAADPRCLHKP